MHIAYAGIPVRARSRVCVCAHMYTRARAGAHMPVYTPIRTYASTLLAAAPCSLHVARRTLHGLLRAAAAGPVPGTVQCAPVLVAFAATLIAPAAKARCGCGGVSPSPSDAGAGGVSPLAATHRCQRPRRRAHESKPGDAVARRGHADAVRPAMRAGEGGAPNPPTDL